MTRDKFLSRTGIAKKLGVTIHHSFVADTFNEIDKDMTTGATKGEVELSGVTIPWQVRIHAHHRLPVVPAWAMSAFEKKAASKPVADNDHLNRTQLADALGIKPSHRLLNDLWVAIKTEMERGLENGEVKIAGAKVNWHRFYSARNIEFPYVNRSSVTALKKVLNNIPRKAAADELSFSRLAELAGVHGQHPLFKRAFQVIEAEVDNQKRMSGTIVVDGTPVEWKMLQATWAGSSKWGNVSPHFTRNAVEPFTRALQKEHESRKPQSFDHPPDRKDVDTTESSSEYNLEDEISLELLVLDTASETETYLDVMAIKTANENLIFEAYGVTHILTPDNKIYQRMKGKSQSRWMISPTLRVAEDYENSHNADSNNGMSGP